MDLSVFIVSRVCRALQYVFERAQIVHRDISPSNIMMTREGTVKLIDFGIATRSGTRDHALTGKPAYMAPEMVTEMRTDNRSDLFSLGAVLYELLTGQRLFRAKTTAEVLEKVVTAPILSVRSLRPDVPEAVEAIVRRALERDPERRYASAAEMGEACEHHLYDKGYGPTNLTLKRYVARLFPEAAAHRVRGDLPPRRCHLAAALRRAAEPRPSAPGRRRRGRARPSRVGPGLHPGGRPASDTTARPEATARAARTLPVATVPLAQAARAGGTPSPAPAAPGGADRRPAAAREAAAATGVRRRPTPFADRRRDAPRPPPPARAARAEASAEVAQPGQHRSHHRGEREAQAGQGRDQVVAALGQHRVQPARGQVAAHEAADVGPVVDARGSRSPSPDPTGPTAWRAPGRASCPGRRSGRGRR